MYKRIALQGPHSDDNDQSSSQHLCAQRSDFPALSNGFNLDNAQGTSGTMKACRLAKPWQMSLWEHCMRLAGPAFNVSKTLQLKRGCLYFFPPARRGRLDPRGGWGCHAVASTVTAPELLRSVFAAGAGAGAYVHKQRAPELRNLL